MVKLNVNGLSERLRDAVFDLSEEYGFSVDDGGYVVKTRIADESKIVADLDGATIYCVNENDFFVGLRYILTRGAKRYEVGLKRKVENLYALCDCSRNAVMTEKTVYKFIRMIAMCGYNKLMLYTEDTYEIDGEPYFGYMRGRYSKDEIKRIVEYGSKFGVELVPCIQTLAHLDGLTKWWRQYDGIIDSGNILLVGNDDTYRLIDRMFATVAECFECKTVNVGMDEAWLLGAGRYLDENGYEDRATIFLKHLTAVKALADKHGLKIAVWSDMIMKYVAPIDSDGNLFLEKTECEIIPKDVKLIAWDYYPESQAFYENTIKRHKRLGNEVWLAGSAFTSASFSADNCRGVRTMTASLKACAKQGVNDYIVTLWGDDGGETSMFSAAYSVCKVASLNLGENQAEFKRSLRFITGLNEKNCLALEFPKDRYMFYNDCLTGVFDTATEVGYENNYDVYAHKLRRAIANKPKYAYVYKARLAYVEVMRIKYAIGVKTRQAYLSGDGQSLKALSDEYSKLIIKLNAFYKAFKRQWEEEKKPFGFEVQDARIGGLIFRVKTCKEKIDDYLSGKIKRIEELETELLDWDGFDEPQRKMLKGNVFYKSAISVNNM